MYPRGSFKKKKKKFFNVHAHILFKQQLISSLCITSPSFSFSRQKKRLIEEDMCK